MHIPQDFTGNSMRMCARDVAYFPSVTMCSPFALTTANGERDANHLRLNQKGNTNLRNIYESSIDEQVRETIAVDLDTTHGIFIVASNLFRWHAPSRPFEPEGN